MKLIRLLVAIILLQSLCDCQSEEETRCGTAADSLYVMKGLQLDAFYDDRFANGQVLNGNSITIADYSVNVGDVVYTMQGDAMKGFATRDRFDFCPCEVATTMTAQPTEPTLQWPAQTGYTVAAIFTEQVSANKDRTAIANDNKAVWAWHSGLNTGKVENGTTTITFDEGRAIRNGRIMDDELPATLESHRIYFWAVWTWNADKTAIVASSQQVPFIAVEDPNTISSTNVKNPFSIQGTWELDSLAGVSYSEFPIRGLEVTGESCPEPSVVNLLDANGNEFSTRSTLDSLHVFKTTSIKTNCFNLVVELSSSDAKVYARYRRK